MDPDLLLATTIHDAAICRAVVDWSSDKACLRVVVSPVDGPVFIATFSPLREFRATRRDPWGPSDLVNEARFALLPADEVIWEVEMQSGDALRVIADGVSVEPAEPSEGARLGSAAALAVQVEFLRRFREEHPSATVGDLVDHVSTADGRTDWGVAVSTVLLGDSDGSAAV